MADPTQERWLPVTGYEGYYEVSDHGNIRSVDRVVPRGEGTLTVKGTSTAQFPDRDGYRRVNLHKDGINTLFLAHRLVMLAFGGPPTGDQIVCHNDGDPANNHVSNLRWGTHSSNMYDKRGHGTCHQISKTHCPRGHRLHGANVRVKGVGQRCCKACNRASAKKAVDPTVDFDAYADWQYERLRSSDPTLA